MKILGIVLWTALVLSVIVPAALIAGEADVIDVKTRHSAGAFDFAVTVEHADTGWDHYANRWEVLGPGGEVLAKRVLYHPHVNEQPFTRNLSGVRIDDGIDQVTIRAHDSVHAYGGKTVTVDLLR